MMLTLFIVVTLFSQIKTDGDVNSVNLPLDLNVKLQPAFIQDEYDAVPYLRHDYFHFTYNETIQGANSVRTQNVEIHASLQPRLMRRKVVARDVTTTTIYDYNLQVFHVKDNNGDCKSYVADSSTPGASSDGYFHSNSILFLSTDFDRSYSILEKVDFKHSSGAQVYAWKKTFNGVYIDGEKVDKAVVTQYFVKSGNLKDFAHADEGYDIVRTTIARYKLDSSQSLSLIDTITRDYVKFESTVDEPMKKIHNIFTINDCPNLSNGKKQTLGFKFQSLGDYGTESKLTESHLYTLKEDFLYWTILAENVDPMRIDTVNYIFNDTNLEIEMTFLDAFDFKSLFSPKTMSVSAATFSQAHKFKAYDALTCLNVAPQYSDSVMAAIFRQRDNTCAVVTRLDDLKEAENGESCSVYIFPLNNWSQISYQLPLAKVQHTYSLYKYKWFYTPIKTFELRDVIVKS